MTSGMLPSTFAKHSSHSAEWSAVSTSTKTDTGTPGASDTTLLSGPNGSSLVGIYTSPDGRQTMYQTFNQNQYMLQSELLRHGELAWLSRSTYFGDQRNYLETHVDDNFLSDAAWSVAGNALNRGALDGLQPGRLAA